jgi:hypothetical protein
MTVFRWLIGVFAGLSALAALAAFVLHLASNMPEWLLRARRFRHWTWLGLLLWFNVEVWGRVLMVIIHWSR